MPPPSDRPEPEGKVADAVSGNWVDSLAPEASRPFLRLSRADRPIGSRLALLGVPRLHLLHTLELAPLNPTPVPKNKLTSPFLKLSLIFFLKTSCPKSIYSVKWGLGGIPQGQIQLRTDRGGVGPP